MKIKVNEASGQVQDLLAHFICADKSDTSLLELSKFKTEKNVAVGFEVDAGARFKFTPRSPTTAHICDLSESREYAIDARLLMHTPQDLLGNHAEIAMVEQRRSGDNF